jgi:alpha-glucosidase
MRAAVLIQMTWPGAPTIYYGDEAGVTGWTDPDNRRTYPWGHEDKELIALHKELIRIHKDYDAIKKGSLIYLGGERNFISYGRFDKKDKLIIAVNRSDSEMHVDIPAWQIGITDEEKLCSLITTTAEGYSLEARMYRTDGGFLHLTLGGVSAVVIKNVVW